MPRIFSIFAALLLAVAVSPASAADGPNPGIVAGTGASVALAQTPGAKAVIDEASASIEGEVSAFSSTSASLHTEDQCSVTDLSVSRSRGSIGQTFTFVFYNVNNLCDPALSAFGSLEVPDTAFTGDPRTTNKLTLVLDLTGSPLVSGPPGIFNITWIKTPPAPNTLINRSSNTNVSDTRDANGVRTILKFTSVFTSVTARMVNNDQATSTLTPFDENTTAMMFWDNSKSINEMP